MALYLGIDLGHTTVRAALLRTSYRRTLVTSLFAQDVAEAGGIVEALRSVAPMVARCDGIAVALDGDQIFSRRLELPLAAQRQLTDIVPGEIEAQIPFDITDAVFDYRILSRLRDQNKINIFATVARHDLVRARIELITQALGVQPDMVVPGSFGLASLSILLPELARPETICLVDLGASHTEVVILSFGEAVFGRTLSAGTQGLPASATALARELRQTLSSWRAAGGAAVDALYLVGGGAAAEGAGTFLGSELGIAVSSLPVTGLEGLSEEQIIEVPKFAKAIGLATGLTARSRTLNLRRGSLAYERGYGFLREKIPLLVALGIVIVVSFIFATLTEMHALSKQRALLEKDLAYITKEILGQEITDSGRVLEMIEQASAASDEDPMPRVDAFDVLVQLAQAVPKDIKHDIEEIDVQRSGPQSAPRVSIHGIVPNVQDAENLAEALKKFRCFQDIKIVKKSQQVGGDRQKYHMEFDLKCPDDKKKTPATSASAAATDKEPK